MSEAKESIVTPLELIFLSLELSMYNIVMQLELMAYIFLSLSMRRNPMLEDISFLSILRIAMNCPSYSSSSSSSSPVPVAPPPPL
jgi:hypothetical protein